jgi:hypothetical protein
MVAATIHPLAPEEMVELRVVVRSADAHDLQQLIVNFAAARRTGGAWTPPYDRSHGPNDAWQLPDWANTKYDRDAMNWIVGVLRPPHLEILARILTAPEAMPTSELLSIAGYADDVDASPVFKAIGGRFRRCDRRPIWTGGEKTSSGQRLGRTSNRTARRLFLTAFRAQHPDLADKVA